MAAGNYSTTRVFKFPIHTLYSLYYKEKVSRKKGVDGIWLDLAYHVFLWIMKKDFEI